jgi:hypothetical protein
VNVWAQLQICPVDTMVQGCMVAQPAQYNSLQVAPVYPFEQVHEYDESDMSEHWP